MFKPLQDRVLVKRDEAEKMTEGGIIIPDSAEKKMNRGTVISVGEGKMLEDGTYAPVEVKAGDTVYFGQFSGTELKIGGEACTILREDELLGVEE